MASTLKFDAVMIVMSVLSSLLMLFVLYLVRRVYTLVGLTDLPMLLQVIALALSLTCKLPEYRQDIGLLTYCVLSSIEDFLDPYGPFYTYLATTEILREIDFMKIEFLFSALLFDLYKW